MSDVIISGDTAIRKAPTPAPAVEVEMKPAPIGPDQIPQPDGDVVLRRIQGEPIHMDESGDALRKEIRSRKEREPDRVYEWKAANAMPVPGESESTHKQIKRASESMRDARIAAQGKWLTELPGVSEEAGRNVAEILASAPPTKVQVVLDDGRVAPALFDNQPIREADSFQNMNEARRAMANYRAAEARAQEQLLSDLRHARRKNCARQKSWRGLIGSGRPHNSLPRSRKSIRSRLNGNTSRRKRRSYIGGNFPRANVPPRRS